MTSVANLRGIVLDLDGTLIDSYGAIADSVNHAREGLGLDRLDEATIRGHVGRGLESLMRDVVGERHAPEAVRLFREHYARVWPRRTTLLPGVADGLERLHRAGIRLSVASNKPARFGRAIADELGFARWLDVVHGPDSTGATKPDPAMITACLVAMKAPADRSVYVGDMPLDVESGRRAGLDTWLVATGSVERPVLEETGIPVFPDFGALTDALLRG